MQRASDLLDGVSIFAPPIYNQIIEHAHSAMEELWKIGLAEKNPIWQQHKEYRYEILNDNEYLKHFGRVDATLRKIVKMVEVGELQTLPSFDACQSQNPMSTKEISEQGSQIEASRDMALIKISPINLVGLLMDVNQWSTAFYNIVSRARVLGSFSDGVEGIYSGLLQHVVEGSYSGKLHVISAEFHLPSPAIPTRECSFARYCKQFYHNQWAIVDVSLEDILPSPSNNFRKRPSGCLIIGMPDGNSKVIWVEHMVADHSQLNPLFKPLVTSGLAFGATRWLASIVRHIELSESLKSTKLIARLVIHQTEKTNLLKLADRLMRRFCANLSSTISNSWKRPRFPNFPNSTDVRVMLANNVAGSANNPLGPSVVFCTTIWLNVSPNRLFDFLRNPKSRNKWDKLSQTLSVQEFASMLTGKHPENRVSFLRASTSTDETEIFYIQESRADATASYVMYAPIDEPTLKSLVHGSNPDPEEVIAFPSGFAIIPGGLPRDGDQGKGIASNESLLTISFNIVDKSITASSIPYESVLTIHNLITETVTAIKDAILYHSRLNNWDQDEVRNRLAAE